MGCRRKKMLDNKWFAEINAVNDPAYQPVQRVARVQDINFAVALGKSLVSRLTFTHRFGNQNVKGARNRNRRNVGRAGSGQSTDSQTRCSHLE
jgi:hypothetical protein